MILNKAYWIIPESFLNITKVKEANIFFVVIRHVVSKRADKTKQRDLVGKYVGILLHRIIKVEGFLILKMTI